MEMPKLAIIIPAYNAERGLARSVRSALAQTMREIEVWITDDGSTDRSGEIADRLAAEDARVRVIHQANGGCYQARLNALTQIKTPWFGFLDADDTIEPTMFEKMLNFAERERLDVVRCSYDGAKDLGIAGLSDCGIVAETRQAVYDAYVRPALIEGKRGGTFVWNMLYRNKYDFAAFDPTDHDTNFEDMILNLQFFLKVERMGFLHEPLYHYATTTGSAVHSFGENKLKDFREVCRVRRELLPRYGVNPDGPENRSWFRLNRMNCIKATMRAENLTWAKKLSIIWRLMR